MTLTAAVESLVQGSLHRRANLFKITRDDGAILRFTDHSSSLTYFEVDTNAQFTYSPVGGFDMSAVKKEADGEELNVSFQGMVSAGYVTLDDLRAGRYDGAKVEQLDVDFRYPWAGPIDRHVFYVSELQFDGQVWTAELIGQTRKLQTKVGEVYTRGCTWFLGQGFGDDTKPGCKFDVASMSFYALAISSVTDRQTFAISSLPASLGDDYFAFGDVLFLTDDNRGITRTVKSWDSSTGGFELFLPTPFDITNGGLVNALVGCDLLSTTCKGKFDNFRNYGGYSFLEGTDKLTRSVK